MRRQSGITTVEFALVGAVALLILIGCLEIGRMLYVWNTVGEATRRAAHVAAICPMNDPAIAQAAMVVPSGDKSAVLNGLTAGMVQVTYLTSTGGTTTDLGSVQYVSVAISGYTHTLLLGGLMSLFGGYAVATVAVPPFTTTVPRESLGYVPDTDSYACIGS